MIAVNFGVVKPWQARYLVASTSPTVSPFAWFLLG